MSVTFLNQPDLGFESESDDEEFRVNYFFDQPWAWFPVNKNMQPLTTWNIVRTDGTGQTTLPEKFDKIVVRVATDPFDFPDLFHLKESSIPNAGNGLFAARDFDKNTIITEFMGQTFYLDEVSDEKAEYAMTNSYNIARAPTSTQTLRFAHFMNMANTEEEVNCEVLDIIDHPYHSWHVLTLKDVKAGEELFLDYRRDGGNWTPEG